MGHEMKRVSKDGIPTPQKSKTTSSNDDILEIYRNIFLKEFTLVVWRYEPSPLQNNITEPFLDVFELDKFLEMLKLRMGNLLTSTDLPLVNHKNLGLLRQLTIHILDEIIPRILDELCKMPSCDLRRSKNDTDARKFNTGEFRANIKNSVKELNWYLFGRVQPDYDIKIRRDLHTEKDIVPLISIKIPFLEVILDNIFPKYEFLFLVGANKLKDARNKIKVLEQEKEKDQHFIKRGLQFSMGNKVSEENLKTYKELDEIQNELVNKYGTGQRSGDSAAVREYNRRKKLHWDAKRIKNVTNNYNHYKNHIKNLSDNGNW